MEERATHFCVFCSKFWNIDESIRITCPTCNEYKGLIPAAEAEEDN